MASYLNAFKILSYNSNILEVEVTILQNEQNIAGSTNFALQIALELYANMKRGYIYNDNYDDYPFTEDEAIEILKRLPTNELDSLLKKLEGDEQEITATEYNKIIKTGIYEYDGKKVRSLGSTNNICTVSFKPDYDAFCKLADEYIEKVEVLSTTHFPHWFGRMEIYLEYGKLDYGFNDEVFDRFSNEPYPNYILRITFNEDKSAIFNYIRSGCKWHSAAYELSINCKNYISNKKEIYHTLQYDVDIPIPHDTILLAWWNGLDKNWQYALLDNLFVQKKYTFAVIKEKYHHYIFRFVLEDQLGKEFLDTYHNEPVSIEDLRLIAKLKILYLSGYQLNNLEPVSILKGLKILLSEGGNEFENLDALEHLKNLEELQIALISDTKPSTKVIQNLDKLRLLYFDPATIEEVNSLKKLPQLRELNFMAFFEVDAAIFIDFLALKKLSVSECGGMDDSIKQENIQKLRDKGIEVIWQVEGENYEIINY